MRDGVEAEMRNRRGGRGEMDGKKWKRPAEGANLCRKKMMEEEKIKKKKNVYPS